MFVGFILTSLAVPSSSYGLFPTAAPTCQGYRRIPLCMKAKGRKSHSSPKRPQGKGVQSSDDSRTSSMGFSPLSQKQIHRNESEEMQLSSGVVEDSKGSNNDIVENGDIAVDKLLGRRDSSVNFADNIVADSEDHEETVLPANDGRLDSAGGVVKEVVSGSTGDATPHQAFNPSGRGVLTNPLELTAAEARHQTPAAEGRVTVDMSKFIPSREARWRWDITFDAMMEQLASAKANGHLEGCVVSNRDFVSERMLYRFTSAILQAESRDVGDAAINMRSLRDQVIALCWDYDRPLREILGNAEERLVSVIKDTESDLSSSIGRACGTTQVEANSLWIVAYAAVAAWEVQNPNAHPENYSAVQKRLNDIAKAMTSCKKLKKILSPCLSVVEGVLVANDSESQLNLIADMDENMLIELGIIIEQIRFWPLHSYGELVRKLGDIRTFAIQQVLKVGTPELVPFRFTPAEINRTSRLVDFQSRNANRAF